MSPPEKETPGSIWEIDRPRSVRDQAIETILNGIADGHLPVGRPLPSETALSSEMGISRVALREAVKQLEVLGFLRIDRGNGTVVTLPDFRPMGKAIELLGKMGSISLKDLHELRLLIEVDVVRQVAAKGDRKLVKRLEEILEQASRNIETETGYVDLDFEFHKEIMAACPNRLLGMLLAPFDEQLRKSRKLSFGGRQETAKALTKHRKILAAIRGRDPDAAGRLMREHLRKTARDLKLKEF